MSYKYEKNLNGEQDLVISGWEDGIADSPFKGIGNIRNLNINFYNGVAYVNYKRKACTMSGATMKTPRYAVQSPNGFIYISDSAGNIFKQDSVNASTFTALTGCPGTPAEGLQFWNDCLFAFDSTQINICGPAGASDSGINSGNWNTAAATTGVWPIKSASLSLTGAPVAGETSATISSYTDAQGNSRTVWNGPTGVYPMNFNFTVGSQIVYAQLTQGVAAFNWYPALNFDSSSGTSAVQPMQGINVHPSLVSINDGNLYFGNEQYVSSFELLPNQVFAKGDMKTFRFNASALSLPPKEVVQCLTEIRNLLLAGALYKIYPWDRFSPQWQNPVPMQEQLIQMINILNNVYIFAGNKGNIYITNGYNAQRFKKLPDNIAGVVDPAWQWGGIMSHRQKLFFQALAINGQTNSPIIAGIFSLDLDSGALNMEAQNSFGLSSATTTSPGVLIDNNTVVLNYDNYYSAWSNGSSSNGGTDFNDTTLWSSSEPLIETDIVPIGTAAQLKTFSSAEFKLDQPLQSGDSISLYARQSLADTYTLIGTTNTAVLSEFYPNVSFQNWQWIQFKVTMTCNPTATASSFNRIREIRIR